MRFDERGRPNRGPKRNIISRQTARSRYVAARRTCRARQTFVFRAVDEAGNTEGEEAGRYR